MSNFRESMTVRICPETYAGLLALAHEQEALRQCRLSMDSVISMLLMRDEAQKRAYDVAKKRQGK